MQIIEKLKRAKNLFRHAPTLLQIHRKRNRAMSQAEIRFQEARRLTGRSQYLQARITRNDGHLLHADSRSLWHERESLRTGTGFWERHDIDAWAKRAAVTNLHTRELVLREVPKVERPRLFEHARVKGYALRP